MDITLAVQTSNVFLINRRNEDNENVDILFDFTFLFCVGVRALMSIACIQFAIILNDINLILKYTPRISSHFKLVPVSYRS